MNRVRLTTAARRLDLSVGAVRKAKYAGVVRDAGHGYVYEEEVAAAAKSGLIKRSVPKPAVSRLAVNRRRREDMAAEEAHRFAEHRKSMSYEEAAELYGVTEQTVKKWKYAARLTGPYNRVWRGQADPREKPEHGAGKAAHAGSHGYRVVHRAPGIDVNDW